jgi:hypothetical protein
MRLVFLFMRAVMHECISAGFIVEQIAFWAKRTEKADGSSSSPFAELNHL